MGKERKPVEKIIVYALLIFIGIMFLSPFIFMISISLASDSTNVKGAFTFIPKEFHFENYLKIFEKNSAMGTHLRNSIIFVFFCIVGQVFSSSYVAFGFARLRAKGKNVLFLMLLATLMIPQDVYIIPQFMLFKKIGWLI